MKGPAIVIAAGLLLGAASLFFEGLVDVPLGLTPFTIARLVAVAMSSVLAVRWAADGSWRRVLWRVTLFSLLGLASTYVGLVATGRVFYGLDPENWVWL